MIRYLATDEVQEGTFARGLTEILVSQEPQLGGKIFDLAWVYANPARYTPSAHRVAADAVRRGGAVLVSV